MTPRPLAGLARRLPVVALLLAATASPAAVLNYDVNESRAERVGPFSVIFTTGEVVLCDGAVQGRHTGCGRDVAISDIVTFTAVRMEGSYFQMKSANESSDPDGVGEVPPPADVDQVLTTATDNIVYLAEQLGSMVYTPESGEPGFIRLSTTFSSTFNITSDIAEPATAWLWLAGLVAAAAARRAARGRHSA